MMIVTAIRNTKEEEEDEDDPFADRNAVKSSFKEEDGLTW